MKYLISGQSGFIGQAITKYLQNKGETVIPIPRNETLYALIRLFENDTPDYIIHLSLMEIITIKRIF